MYFIQVKPAIYIRTGNDYSGRLLLRMPKTLHQRLAEAAEKEGVSLNQYIVFLLSNA